MMSKPTDKPGACGCGRSPTGECCGWHALTEDQYKEKLDQYELAKYQREAQDLWADSCTTPRGTQ